MRPVRNPSYLFHVMDFSGFSRSDLLAWHVRTFVSFGCFDCGEFQFSFTGRFVLLEDEEWSCIVVVKVGCGRRMKGVNVCFGRLRQEISSSDLD